MSLTNEQRQLEIEIGHEFKDKKLFIQALTSKGYSNENSNCPHRETLAAIGDPIVKVIVIENAIKVFHRIEISDIHNFKGNYDSREDLGNYLLLLLGCAGLFKADFTKIFRVNEGEKEQGVLTNKSFLGEFFESLIGAIYFDVGWETCFRNTASILF